MPAELPRENAAISLHLKFPREKDHRSYGYIINRAVVYVRITENIKLNEMVWYFIGVFYNDPSYSRILIGSCL